MTQSFVTRALGLPMFLHLIATALKFLYLVATLSSLLIASACNLMVIRYCLISVVTLRSYETEILLSLIILRRIMLRTAG